MLRILESICEIRVFFKQGGDGDVLSKAFCQEGYIFEDSKGFFDRCTAEDGYCENGCTLEENGERVDRTAVFLLVGDVERVDKVLRCLVNDVAISRVLISGLDSR